MSLRAALPRSCLLAALFALAGCGGPDQAYPRLLPLSDLTAPPEIPAHAADAAADPEAVGAGLRARRDQAAARAGAQGPVTDRTALDARAAALRTRAEALSKAEPRGRASTTLAPAGAAPADPATSSRAEALRQRARQMLEDGSAPALPPCPPGTPNPEAAGCTPR